MTDQGLLERTALTVLDPFSQTVSLPVVLTSDELAMQELQAKLMTAADGVLLAAGVLSSGPFYGVVRGAIGKAASRLGVARGLQALAMITTGALEGAAFETSRQGFELGLGVREELDSTRIQGATGIGALGGLGVNMALSGMSAGKRTFIEQNLRKVDEGLPTSAGGLIDADSVRIAAGGISPSSIRFSQRSVNDTAELTASMRARGWRGDPIDVVRMSDGGLTAVDNTRVLAAHRAGINVQARIHAADDLLPANLVERFTTSAGVPRTWGDAIRLRIQKQGAAFRNRYPSGSPFTGSVD